MVSSFYASMESAARFLEDDIKGREAVAIVRDVMRWKSWCVPPEKALFPVVVVEGLDGTGKSTLVANLKEKLGESALCLKSPPEELSHLRSYFDEQPKQIRRAFYVLSNYACAVRMRLLASKGPVIVDRFWPSTVAYALAHDFQIMPEENPELLQMPKDLAELLPRDNPMVFLLLELSESERAARVRARADVAPVAFCLAVTREEEEELERSKSHRTRLTAAYHAITIDGQPLTVCEASGTTEEVLARAFQVIQERIEQTRRLMPTSVNWHYTRACNYACKFCFHTAKTSFFLPKSPSGMQEAKQCLIKLRRAGMKKMNFSGGEPFLQAKELGELCRFCKQDLRLESVSIVSNGSLIKKSWLEKFGNYVDILAISCDSFKEETNKLIGRGKGMHLSQLEQVRGWCYEFEVPFKINSVINIFNVEEDMTAAITRLQPVRWKVFQCLLLDGENAGDGALRDALNLVITSTQFEHFLKRHQSLKCMVPEDNKKMKDSYLILDEELRFLNCTGGSKTPSRSIRNVSVEVALQEAGFDADMFVKRGGIYNWTKPAKQLHLDIEDMANCTTLEGQHANIKNTKKQISSKRRDNTPLAYLVWGVIVIGCVSTATALRLLANKFK